MNVFYDTEFLEDGKTIEPISIGMVSDTGDTYYAIFQDAPWTRIANHQWLMENVVTSLPTTSGQGLSLDLTDPAVKPRSLITSEVKGFLHRQMGQDERRNFDLWAWYGAYDHVVLMQLFGRMVDCPTFIPNWTNDLRQEYERLGRPNGMPAVPVGEHNALVDAYWNKEVHMYLKLIAAKS